MTRTSRGVDPPPMVDRQSRARFDRRISARIFELFARTSWLGFLAGAALAEIGLYGWQVAAGNPLAPDTMETATFVLALTGALFEGGVATRFSRGPAPLASLAGALKDIALLLGVVAVAGGLLATALRLESDGAHPMLAATVLGPGVSVALWLLVRAHAWSDGLAVEHRRLEEAILPMGGGPPSVGRLYGAARLVNPVTRALLMTIYVPVALIAMLGARLLRMRREPLYYRCRLQGCAFRSTDPAIQVRAPGVAPVHGGEPVRTWPTLDRPLFVRSPREGTARLVPTWHGLDRLERAAHRRDNPRDCAGLCRRAYRRRLLVLGESGTELATVHAAIHRAAANRLDKLSPQALACKHAIDEAVAGGRWGVTSRGTTRVAIGGRLRAVETAGVRGTASGHDPAGGRGLQASIDVDIVSDFARAVWAPAYGAIVVLPMPTPGDETDRATFIASRLAQIRARRPPVRPHAGPDAEDTPAARDAPAGAVALLRRLLGAAQAEDDAAGLPPGRTVVFLPAHPGAEYTDLRMQGVRVIADADELSDFVFKEVLQ